MSSHIQQEGVLVFVASDAPPRHIAQEGVLVFRENTPDAVASTGRAYFHG